MVNALNHRDRRKEAFPIDNPDLIGDSNFIKTCESIADPDRPMNTDQMNEAVFQLLDRAQVKPAPSPPQKSDIKLKSSLKLTAN